MELKEIKKEGYVFNKGFTIEVEEFLNMFDFKPFNSIDLLNTIFPADEEDLTKLTIEQLQYIFNELEKVDYWKFWDEIKEKYNEWLIPGDDDILFDMRHEKWGL